MVFQIQSLQECGIASKMDDFQEFTAAIYTGFHGGPIMNIFSKMFLIKLIYNYCMKKDIKVKDILLFFLFSGK